MAEFAKRQIRTQSGHLVSPAKPDQATPRPANAENSLLSSQQALGNQTVQRLLHAGVVQAKRKVNESGDQYEQEADRVAEQVMRMAEPQASKGQRFLGWPSPLVFSAYAPKCEDELHRQPMEEEEEEEIFQAKEIPGLTPEVTPDMQAQINALRGGGQPLPESARAFFEPRFGYDFSQMRIHTDAQAAESARAVKARAFTLGQEMVFGAGEYSPDTATGRRLLAHELTHVVQQRASAPSLQLQPLTEEDKKENLKSPRFAGNQRLQDAFDNSPAMRKGEKGEAVKILQQALIDDSCPPGTQNCAETVMPVSTKKGTQPPDGDFGDETFIAVQKFQIKHGLLDKNGRPDGRPGRKTLRKLDELFPGPSKGSCSFEIFYANERKAPCAPASCGGGLVFDIQQVSAAGAGCPPTLEGLQLAEKVKSDDGCIPGDVVQAKEPVCTIGPDGKIPPPCGDAYRVCFPKDLVLTFGVPRTPCTQKVTQKIFVGDVHAQTRVISFSIPSPSFDTSTNQVTCEADVFIQVVSN